MKFLLLKKKKIIRSIDDNEAFTVNSYSPVLLSVADGVVVKYIFSIKSKISFCKFGLLTLSSYLFGFKSFLEGERES